MSGAVEGVALREAQDARQVALIERLGTIADLACATPLPGDLGDVAYDLLRQAAAQISSDRLHIARLTIPPARSYADEDVARIIAPDQWRAREGDIAHGAEWHRKADRYAVEADPNLFPLGQQAIDRTVEAWRGLAERFITGADDRVKDSLAKAAAIRLLSQGEKA